MITTTITRTPGTFPRTKAGQPLVTVPDATLTPQGDIALVEYRRPSSAGQILENTLGLQKWHERNLVTGLATEPDLYRAAVEAISNGDKARTVDQLIRQAKEAAGGNLAANRGTFIHKLIETSAVTDTHLGITPDMQQDILTAWCQFVDVHGLDIVDRERTVICDQYRYAGTLDIRARLNGRVAVVDIKTGKDPRSNSYIPQLAIYAMSQPYDTDLGTRGAWDQPTCQETGYLAHLNLAAVIDGHTPAWELIPVALEHGRWAIELAEQVTEWRSRKAYGPAVKATLPAPTRRDNTVADLVNRLRSMDDNARNLVRARWPFDRPASQLDSNEARQALALCDDIARDLTQPFTATEITPPAPPAPKPTEPPTAPWQAPDSGGPVDPVTRDTIRAAIDRLPTATRDWCRETVREAQANNRPVGNGTTVRSLELLRLIIAAGTALHDLYDGDTAAINEVLRAATGRPAQPTGMLIGTLTTVEAQAASEHLEQLYGSPSALRWDTNGDPYLAA